MSDVSDAGAAFLAATEDPPSSPADAALPAVDGETAAAPEPSAGAPEAAAAPTPEAEVDKGPVPWGEHKKATDEAARYRTQLRTFEDAFGGFHPDDASLLLKAVGASAKLIAQGDHAQAAGIWKEIAGMLGPEVADQVQAAAGDLAGDDDDELLTKSQLQQMLAERDQEAAAERDVQTSVGHLKQTAASLGYAPDSDDPDQQAEWARVLTEAVTFHDGDLTAAHESVKARDQAAIDRYLAGKSAVAGAVPRVSDGAAPTPASEQPKDFTEARQGLEAFLASQ